MHHAWTISLIASQVAHIISEAPELRRLATDPFVPAIVRKQLISNLFKDSGAHKITVNLLGASVFVLEQFCSISMGYQGNNASSCPGFLGAHACARSGGCWVRPCWLTHGSFRVSCFIYPRRSG